jgi:hypothetical protein
MRLLFRFDTNPLVQRVLFRRVLAGQFFLFHNQPGRKYCQVE